MTCNDLLNDPAMQIKGQAVYDSSTALPPVTPDYIRRLQAQGVRFSTEGERLTFIDQERILTKELAEYLKQQSHSISKILRNPEPAYFREFLDFKYSAMASAGVDMPSAHYFAVLETFMQFAKLHYPHVCDHLLAVIDRDRLV